MLMYFNTSHVSVRGVTVEMLLTSNVNFNTSHVSVREENRLLLNSTLSNFNTSHVSVRDNNISNRNDKKTISIHLMCRFE